MKDQNSDLSFAHSPIGCQVTAPDFTTAIYYPCRLILRSGNGEVAIGNYESYRRTKGINI